MGGRNGPHVGNSHFASRTFRGFALLAGGALLAIVGCKPAEEIQTYSVPKEVEVPEVAEVPQGELPAGRTLGAIVVRPAKGWFFKLMGPAGAVAAHSGEFDAFVKSLHFDEQGGPQWTVPAGWRESPQKAPMRYATLMIDANPKPLELTVSELPHGSEDESEYILKNVNRWRNQLQLPPIGRQDLASETSTVELDGASAITVNIEGKLAPQSMGRPPFAPGGGDGK